MPWLEAIQELIRHVERSMRAEDWMRIAATTNTTQAGLLPVGIEVWSVEPGEEFFGLGKSSLGEGRLAPKVR